MGIALHADAGSRLNADGTTTAVLKPSFIGVFDSAFQVVGVYAM